MKKNILSRMRACMVLMVVCTCMTVIMINSNTSSAAAVTRKVGKGQVSTANGTVSINKSQKVIRLTKSGTYTLKGSFTSYRVVVSKRELNVKILLNNVTMSNTKTACIYNTKKSTSVTVQSVKGTTNTFSGPTAFPVPTGKSKASPSGVIFSDGNLRLTGHGKITVQDKSSNGDAIGSKRRITVSAGNVSATSKSAAIHGQDVYINNGTIKAVASDTGIKASGYVNIVKGNITVNAVDKGIQGKKGVTIKGGTLYIKTTKSSNSKFEDFRGITAGVSGSNGKKAVSGSIYVYGGTIKVNSYGDCMHASTNITITAGTFNLTSTADDGIQAKAALTITGSPKLTISAKGKKTKAATKNIAGNIKY